MSSPDSRVASADIPAVVVPSGEPVVIPAGTHVQITHRLGGNLTLTWEYGMVRVSGQYAANLGEKAQVIPQKEKRKRDEGAAPFDEDIWEALKNVFDPEIPVNIVDLGLIYSMEAKPITEPAPASPKEQKYKVWIKMTLTAPGCGMGPSIAADAQERVRQVDGVSDSQVDIVWDPPWNQGMISEEGRMALGMV